MQPFCIFPDTARTGLRRQNRIKRSPLLIDNRLLLSRSPALGFPLFSNRGNVELVPLTVTHILDLVLDARRDQGTMATAPPPAAVAVPTGTAAVPAAYGTGARLDPDYLEARRQLTALLDTRMANLPESTRAKLEVNLAEMRRAALQINAALAEQPGDPLLEELLLKTYQDELAVLANVNQLAGALAGTADPKAADPKRMQL